MEFKSRLPFFILILSTILTFPLIVYAQTAIDCGQTLSASVGVAGERDSYTFTASANDGITIRARKTLGSLTPYLELYNPSGRLITSAANKINRILTVAGTYTVVVRDQNNTNTGDYLLYWQRMNNPCGATATTCGQVLAGSIGTAIDPPPWRAYTFTAAANDAVSIRSVRTSAGSLTPLMELYGPTGSFITSNYNGLLDRVLTTAGTYTILMSDYNNLYAGDFLLVWQRMSNPCIASPVNCGQVLSNSIVGSGEMDVYTFTASANDGVTIRARKTSGTFSQYIELYGPTGTRVTTSSSGKIDRVLTTAGTYKIIVRDSSYVNTGDYLLYWERISHPCNTSPIDCGQVVAGSIGTAVDPPPWRCSSFSASANDSVTIRVAKTSGTLTPYLELYGPTGSLVGSGAGRLDRTLTTAGTHMIVVRDQSNLNAGNYLLSWLRVNNPCNGTPIGCGKVLSGAVSIVGKIDAYTLTVKAGDTIVLTLTKTSGGFDPYLELYNSSGTRVAYKYTSSGSQVTITQTLSTGGAYTVFVSDYGNNETGSYTLSFQKNNNFCGEVTVSAANKIGIFHDGTWELDLNGNHTWDLPGDMLLNFGQAGDKPVTGDWDGIGTTKIGTFRDGIWKIDLNGSGLWEWEGDRIYAGSLNSTGSFNNDWTFVPGSAASSPALAWNPIAKKMQIVVRRAGDTIYAGSFNSSGVFNNDWTLIAGTALSTPALAWNPVAKKMQIVVRRAGDTIYAGTFSSSGVFNNDWTLIPGTTLSSPAIAWNDSLQRMQIAVQGGSNVIYAGTFDTSARFENYWAPMPGNTFSPPALAWNPLAFKMQIVVRGSGDAINAGSFNSAGAFNNDWTLISGTTLSSPALAWNPSAFKMQIVVRGANDTLSAGSFNSIAAFNNDWATIPGSTLSSPAIAWNQVTKTMQLLSYGPKDAVFTFGMAGDIPVTGDWDGSGITKIGVFRNGSWFLDLNGNGVLDPEDGSYTFGQAGDVPVAGDWNGNGITKIGVFRNGSWFLDLNGNRVLEYPGRDAFFTFGLAGDTPVITGALQTAEIDSLLRSMWTSMNNSLASGDIQTALLYITPASRPSYEVMFNALISQMPSILATHREFNLIYIKSKEAKYELVTLEGGELHSYDVIFTKYENNVWGIDDF